MMMLNGIIIQETDMMLLVIFLSQRLTKKTTIKITFIIQSPSFTATYSPLITKQTIKNIPPKITCKCTVTNCTSPETGTNAAL